MPTKTGCCTRRVIAGVLASSLTLGAALADQPLPSASSPFEVTYLVDGRMVTLSDGRADHPAAPRLASKITTRIFGNLVYGDLNGDGQADAVFWLMHRTGGSGTFYYVASAIREASGYRGTVAVFIGDRIKPSVLAINQGVVSVRYFERNRSETMVEKPTKGARRFLK